MSGAIFSWTVPYPLFIFSETDPYNGMGMAKSILNATSFLNGALLHYTIC